MPEVSAVVFDVGGVLYRWQMRLLFEQLIDDPAELDWFLANVVTEEWHFERDHGVSLAEALPPRIAMHPAYETHINAYATRFNETIPGPVPGSIELVEALDARGVPLYAITNFGHEFWQGFRPTAPVFTRFRDIVVSGTEKLAKPHAPIFHLAERRFGHPAGAMLFIDDNAANIEAASALGWQVHLFTDAETLEADLTARGLL